MPQQKIYNAKNESDSIEISNKFQLERQQSHL